MHARPSFLSFVVTGACFLTQAAARSDCLGDVRIEVQADQQASHTVGVSAGFGSNFSRVADQSFELVRAEPFDACSTPEAAYPDQAVLVQRGTCNFTEKAENVQRVGARFMLLAETEDGTECVSMGDSSGDGQAKLILRAATISKQAAGRLQGLLEAGEKVQVAPWAPTYSRYDSSEIVMWLLAVAAVTAAAFWAGHDYQEEHMSHQPTQVAASASSKKASQRPEVTMITPQVAVIFVVFASIMLLALYFFLSHIFFLFLLTVFCIASAQAIVIGLTPALEYSVPNLRDTQFILPRTMWTVSAPVAILGPPVAALVIIWALCRQDAWAWPIQDTMGLSMMLLILRQFRLPSIKVACILLPLCFLYDIFWVFLQPLLTHSDSVMVDVAKGGSSHETMPMLLTVPRFVDPLGGASSMLGFGDIVLPGLLVVFTRIFDISSRDSLHSSAADPLSPVTSPLPTSTRPSGAATPRPPARYMAFLQIFCKSGSQLAYFPICVAGYGVGLILTYAALAFSVGGSQGQPALLYLVPCTLGTVAALAWMQGDLGAMWEGVDDEATPQNAFKSSDAGSACQTDEESGFEASGAAGGEDESERSRLMQTASHSHARPRSPSRAQD
ncbi:hypothetical protein WJX74_001342 [Apatococcus lobatus]|uniref:PA domain-containing protein n=1 Tax=Apatococcus lobatus TaxID=904363 RepID=A0AAW1QI93_9CHLO